MSTGFAPPLGKLEESGIGVAAAPTGGMGLALDPNGKVPATALGEGWHEVGASGEPAFANSWVNYVSGYETAAFYKDAAGRIHLKGTIKTGTINTAAFTLPLGYRPALGLLFAIFSNNAVGFLYVASDGIVNPIIGSNVSFSLNVSFRAS